MQEKQLPLQAGCNACGILVKMPFLDIRDRYGITQLVFNPEHNAAASQLANELGREYVILAMGKVAERSSEATTHADLRIVLMWNILSAH